LLGNDTGKVTLTDSGKTTTFNVLPLLSTAWTETFWVTSFLVLWLKATVATTLLIRLISEREPDTWAELVDNFGVPTS
jgi:hypothetical protein